MMIKIQIRMVIIIPKRSKSKSWLASNVKGRRIAKLAQAKQEPYVEG